MTFAQNTRIAISEEQTLVMESARAFCREHSDVHAVRSLLQSAHEPAHRGFAQDVWQKMVDLGWLGASIPEQFGGYNFGIGASVCIAEAMGRNLLATPFFSTVLAAQALQRGASAALQAQWLAKISQGSIGTLALLENEDWGDNGVSCTAVETDEGLLLSGVKKFVCDARSAEFFIVLVCYQNKAGKNHPALVLVETSSLPKNAIREHVLIDETKRAACVDFNGIKVAHTQLFDLAKTQATIKDVHLLGALLCAAEATGSAAAALDCTVDYLKTRTQFGKLIGSYQALKHPAVDILIAMDSARSLVYHAATIVTDLAIDKDGEIACRMAKAQATEALLQAGDRAIQFHGAMGFTYECDAQLYLRRGQWCQQQFGDARHHRKRLAALLFDDRS